MPRGRCATDDDSTVQMMVNGLSRVLTEVQGGFPLGAPLLVDRDRDGGGSTITASAIGNSRMFTARQFDEETGLYHYRARAYSPELRRFIQRDPLEYVDGPCAVAYVAAGPARYEDPSGPNRPMLLTGDDAGTWGRRDDNGRSWGKKPVSRELLEKAYIERMMQASLLAQEESLLIEARDLLDELAKLRAYIRELESNLAAWDDDDLARPGTEQHLKEMKEIEKERQRQTEMTQQDAKEKRDAAKEHGEKADKMEREARGG